MKTDEILTQAAETFKERNKIYKDNHNAIGPILRLLFPDGVPPEMLEMKQFHLLDIVLTKITRFARSGLTHRDSVHDAIVYMAMIEAAVVEMEVKNKSEKL